MVLGNVFARREVITPSQLQALLLELMALPAQEWNGLHQSLRKLQPICCSPPHFSQPRAMICLCQSDTVLLTVLDCNTM